MKVVTSLALLTSFTLFISGCSSFRFPLSESDSQVQAPENCQEASVLVTNLNRPLSTRYYQLQNGQPCLHIIKNK